MTVPKIVPHIWKNLSGLCPLALCMMYHLLGLKVIPQRMPICGDYRYHVAKWLDRSRFEYVGKQCSHLGRGGDRFPLRFEMAYRLCRSRRAAVRGTFIVGLQRDRASAESFLHPERNSYSVLWGRLASSCSWRLECHSGLISLVDVHACQCRRLDWSLRCPHPFGSSCLGIHIGLLRWSAAVGHMNGPSWTRVIVLRKGCDVPDDGWEACARCVPGSYRPLKWGTLGGSYQLHGRYPTCSPEIWGPETSP